MTIYLQSSKADRQKIRKEMLRQAESFLRSAGVAGKIKAAARQMVDSALAEERNGNTESSDTQQPAIQ